MSLRLPAIRSSQHLFPLPAARYSNTYISYQVVRLSKRVCCAGCRLIERLFPSRDWDGRS